MPKARVLVELSAEELEQLRTTGYIVKRNMVMEIA